MEPVQNKIIPLLYIVLIGNIGNSVTRCLGASVPRYLVCVVTVSQVRVTTRR